MTRLLQPCPFCGSGAVTLAEAGPRKKSGYCMRCGACGPEKTKRDAAIASWNERKAPAQPALDSDQRAHMARDHIESLISKP